MSPGEITIGATAPLELRRHPQLGFTDQYRIRDEGYTTPAAAMPTARFTCLVSSSAFWAKLELAAAGVHEHGLDRFVTFDTTASAEDDTLEWCVDETNRNFGLAGQTFAESSEQRTATNKVNTGDQQVLRQLWWSLGQTCQHRIDDRRDWLFDG